MIGQVDYAQNLTPSGAMVATISRSPEGPRYLLVHSVDYPVGTDGEWAWGSPSGCLEPGESIADCAARELYEETGIRGIPHPVRIDNIGWAVFYLEIPWETPVRLDPAEHNDYVWAAYEEADRLCRPRILFDSLTAAIRAADAG